MKVKLTVNSPVTASKPTWIVCSKSEGRDISGRSFSFFLFATKRCKKNITHLAKKFSHFGCIIHTEKDTYSCLPRERWSAGGPSCFSLREPLEAVWRRDSLMKCLGNYCSFSRGGLVVSLQFQHYQTSLVVLTMSCRTERDKEDGDDQCWIRNGTDVEVFNAKFNSSKVAVHIRDTRNWCFTSTRTRKPKT